MQDVENVESLAADYSGEVTSESACQPHSGNRDCDMVCGSSFHTVQAKGFSVLDNSSI